MRNPQAAISGAPAQLSRGRSIGSRKVLRLHLALLIVALPWGFDPASAFSEPGAEEWTIERIDRELEVHGDGPLSLENLHGDLRVRIGSPGHIEAHAVVQRHSEDPRRAELETTDEHNGGLRVTFDGADGGETPRSWERRRVDLAVAVPPGSDLRLRTSSGLIEVKGAVGTVDADSGTGEVRLWTASPCRVRTHEGPIFAYLLGEPWSQAARFESVNGSIEVELPPSADVLLEAETSGRLTTDFSVEISWPGQRRKRATARLGAASAKVLAKSENGAIALLRRLPGPLGGEPLGD